VRRLFSARRVTTILTLAALIAAAAAASTAEESIPAPKYGPQAVRLSQSHDYLRQAEAADFWALMPYYVHQFNERACSVASVAMLVNATRSKLDLSTRDELISQSTLLDHIGFPEWARDVTDDDGDGVTIEELGGYVRQSLAQYAPAGYSVETVRVDPNDADLRRRVRQMLIDNERSDDDFVIVVFWQATLTNDPEGEVGHIAPVAAFDEANDRVLILDPDRQWYEPYWVPFETLLAGITKLDPESGRPRGYIWVRKQE
jgi:hypothetical protein